MFVFYIIILIAMGVPALIGIFVQSLLIEQGRLRQGFVGGVVANLIALAAMLILFGMAPVFYIEILCLLKLGHCNFMIPVATLWVVNSILGSSLVRAVIWAIVGFVKMTRLPKGNA